MLRILFAVSLGSVACGSVAGGHGDGGDDDSGAAALALDSATSWVPQSGTVAIAFTITRTTATGPLAVHVGGLPSGVTAADVDVAADASAGTLTFAASTNAELGGVTPVTVELDAGTSPLDMKPFTVMVSGAPGTLDTTFGDAGRRVLQLPDPVIALTPGSAIARAIAQYPASAGPDAGKLVVVADLLTIGTNPNTKRVAIARFAVDGTPDATFGGGTGYALLDPGDAVRLLTVGIAIDSKGRIVVASVRADSASVCINTVMRVTSAGVKDPGFTTYDENPPGGYCGETRGMAILPGDKIEIVGWWNNPDTSQLPLLVQLNEDGSRDTTAFPGGNYQLRMPNPGTSKPVFAPYELVVDHHGNFLLPGFRCNGGWNTSGYTDCETTVGRITPAGAWDTTFGPSHLGYSSLVFGTTPTPNVAVQAFFGLAVDEADHVVAAGWTENASLGAIARFDDTGALDPSFAGSGRLTPALVSGATEQSFDDVVIDAQGRLIAIGIGGNGGPVMMAARVSPSGAVDTNYGTNGVTTVVTLGTNVRAVLQADGRLVASGAYPRAGGGYDLALWRLWP